jgi:2-polyprenyl-6-methoxyphenol hydroxylase-like FAD-dependent oxidoreductase
MIDQEDRTPVLIVGAGGAGLSLSLLLHQQGIASVLVERRPDVARYPRAQPQFPYAGRAVLARPYGFVAWRSRAVPADPPSSLVQVLSQVLCRSSGSSRLQ